MPHAPRETKKKKRVDANGIDLSTGCSKCWPSVDKKNVCVHCAPFQEPARPPRPDSAPAPASLSSRAPPRVESDAYVPILLGVYTPPRIFDTPYEEITRGGAATSNNSAAEGNVQQQQQQQRKVRRILAPQRRPGRPPVGVRNRVHYWPNGCCRF